MKKVLFTIQWYPPKRSANVLCDDKIIKELLKTGEYEIHCLVYKAPNTVLEEEFNGIKIHRFSKGKFFDWYMNKREQKSTFAEKLNRIMLRIRQVLTIPIYPNDEPFACKKFAKKAIELHKKEKFDIVISEHHGLDSLYAGYKLKKFDSNIKFIAILWDPFTGKENAKYLPKKFAEKKLIKSENKILSNADKIIALKPSMPYHLENSINKSYHSKFVFLDIPGIVEKPNATVEPKFIKESKINIIYSGVLSLPERDPTYIVKLLNKTSFAKNINLIFLSIGSGVEKLYALQQEFNGSLVINGYVNQTEINAIYKKADALINLGGSNPLMVPSKIFEYMAYGKPIISAYYIDNESSKTYLKKYPLGFLVDTRLPLDDNLQALEEFLASSLGKTVEFSTVKELFPENTPESYVKIINEI